MRRQKRKASGFSLVEALSALVILVILATIMSVILAESDDVWFLGVGRARSNTAGKDAMAMIVHDLEHAVADDVLSFVIRDDRDMCSSYGFTNSEICLVSLQHDASDTNRVAREICYWVQETTLGGYELVRGLHAPDTTGTNSCYGNMNWYENARDHDFGVIAENVAALRFGAPDTDGDMQREYDSQDNNNLLPRYVDVYLEVLSDRESRQAAHMMDRGLNVSNYIERCVRRYTARVYPHNRQGYRGR